jgi:hypothetical protein
MGRTETEFRPTHHETIRVTLTLEQRANWQANYDDDDLVADDMLQLYTNSCQSTLRMQHDCPARRKLTESRCAGNAMACMDRS